MREQAGLTQRQLAEKLNREHSFVWRIEKGERRLDLVEFFWVCEALGQDAGAIYSELTTQFKCSPEEEILLAAEAPDTYTPRKTSDS